MEDRELQVPVAPIEPPGRRGRGRLVVTGFVGTLVTVAGLAALGGALQPAVPPVAEPPSPTTPLRPPSFVKGPPPPLPTPIPGLPAIADRILPDAPDVVFVRRAGSDAHIDVWRSHERRLVTVRTFRAAFAGLPAGRSTIARLSPDRARLLVHVAADAAVRRGETFRIVTPAGAVTWEAVDLPVGSSAAWAPDGSAIVVSSGAGWLVLELDGERAVEHRVPVGTPAQPIVPVGFSGDARWIYGVRAATVAGVPYVAAVRVARDAASVEPIDALPSDPLEALLPGTRLGETIDPRSGRSVHLENGLGPVPPAVSVFEPDGSLAWRAQLPGLVLLGADWAADGRLLVLGSDQLVDPSVAVLTPFGRTGVAGPAVLTTGPLAAARWVTGGSGLVLLALEGRGAAGTQALALVVLVRTSDGLVATLPVYLAELANVAGIQLLEPDRP